uniref:Pre-C2HC domain-containing protein n=1 Tax=Heliothis virescens TaxID=7102 RepID=A0A2A4IVK9_HELVI
MTRKQKQKPGITIKKLSNELKQCRVSDEPEPPSTNPTGNIVLDSEIKPELLAKWPKLKLKIPPIFLHKPVDFEQHVRKILNMRISFFQPLLGKNYTKITCESFNDHKHMIKYFEKKNLPFHTFGNPSKRKMKVVIRGIPKETELADIKDVLKSASIPVIRVHKMHTKEERKDNTMLVLAVVPYDDEGKKILRVTQLLGHNVKLEPPAIKPRQCYRCQKWGHSQRYCHGALKCVKCAGDHLSKKCERISDQDPLKCANCGADHTANYKQCSHAPNSNEYKLLQEMKKVSTECFKPAQLVTLDNCTALYRNDD